MGAIALFTWLGACRRLLVAEKRRLYFPRGVALEHGPGRHHHQDGRPEEDADPEADGHGDEKLGLHVLPENKGKEPKEGRQRRSP